MKSRCNASLFEFLENPTTKSAASSSLASPTSNKYFFLLDEQERASYLKSHICKNFLRGAGARASSLVSLCCSCVRGFAT